MTSAVCIPHVDRPIVPAESAPPDPALDQHAGAMTMPIRVTGPDDRMLDTRWLLLPDGTGLVKLASTGGIGAGPRRHRPLTAHSRGFGQAVAAALDHGVDRLILTLGESCCTDGGVGALRELGAAFSTSRTDRSRTAAPDWPISPSSTCPGSVGSLRAVSSCRPT